jgi:hypothetical protein
MKDGAGLDHLTGSIVSILLLSNGGLVFSSTILSKDQHQSLHLERYE